MIFEAYLDDKLLYYPNDETFTITNSKLELALNEAGSFEFDIPSCNLRYDDFALRKSMIKVLQNGREIFYGEVREVTQNFDFTKHIYAVGELAFLFDSIQPQAEYHTSPYEMLKSIITYHNSQVETRKKYEIGQVISSEQQIYRYTNREDTLTDIREKLCTPLNIYIKVRKVSGKRYIDLVPLENHGQFCKQEIQFGENLLDYSNNTNASDIATCCIPLGKRLEDEERTGNCPPALDEYLTIVGTSVNAFHKKTEDDYVVNDSAVAQFGYVRVVKNWDDVTIKENLKDKAIEWLKSAQFETMILELNALDLNFLDSNIDSFDVGDTIHAWALPFGMDTNFPVQKKTIFLNDLDKNTVVLGNTFNKSYTQQASKAVEALTEELPEISPILKSAKDNALAMLLAETTGGHIVYEYDETNSYIEAINVCNANTIENSTQRWVFNLKGLGFMQRKPQYVGTKDQGWEDLKVAITMDGHIVADFITAGTIRGITIEGNTIKGGTVSGTTISGSTIEGNTIKGGSIAIGNNFSVDTSGNMKAANADISGTINSSKGKIAGFELASNNMHVGTASDGIWIQGGSGYGCPFGMVAVGRHGYGLIRIGYLYNNRIGILFEVNSSERYFIDLYDIGKRIW